MKLVGTAASVDGAVTVFILRVGDAVPRILIYPKKLKRR